MTAITVRLSEKLNAQLQERARNLDLNVDALVERALLEFFYLERLNQLRERLGQQFKAQGIENEEDIWMTTTSCN
jgi:predicted transcriptional regulator